MLRTLTVATPLDYLCRRVRLLRSSLFIAIVSLLVLTGYGFDVFGECCSHAPQAQEEHGEHGAKHDEAPAKDQGCQCICHQFVSPITSETVRVGDAEFAPASLVAHADEFPPDAVPLGIEYPPQLA